MIEKVSSLRDVSKPSAIVKGLTEGVRIPVLKDFHASFAFRFSTNNFYLVIIPFTHVEVPLISPLLLQVQQPHQIAISSSS